MTDPDDPAVPVARDPRPLTPPLSGGSALARPTSAIPIPHSTDPRRSSGAPVSTDLRIVPPSAGRLPVLDPFRAEASGDRTNLLPPRSEPMRAASAPMPLAPPVASHPGTPASVRDEPAAPLRPAGSSPVQHDHAIPPTADPDPLTPGGSTPAGGSRPTETPPPTSRLRPRRTLAQQQADLKTRESGLAERVRKGRTSALIGVGGRLVNDARSHPQSREVAMRLITDLSQRERDALLLSYPWLARLTDAG